MLWILVPIIGLIVTFLLGFAVLELLKIPIMIILGIILFDILGNWLGGLLKVKWWLSYAFAFLLDALIIWVLYQSWLGIALGGGIIIALYIAVKVLFGDMIEGFAKGFLPGWKK